ncbi:MAG: Fe-S-containing protein [Treponema sp.]|jgi:uncharacterized membrane protein|nr:Fe-S-containing protein [Treponema sp.]
MLRYLVQVVQNLLTTGILIALLFAACDWEDQGRKRRVFRACIAGAVAALILAVLRRTTGFINLGFFNTWTLCFAVLFGIFYILSQWGLIKPGLLKKYSALNEAFLFAALLFYALPAIFLYPPEFVLAGQSVFSTEFLYKFIGYAVGLTVVIIAGFSLYKTGRALPASLLRVFLTLILAVNMCNQLIAVVQFLLARRIIPMIRWVFRLIIVAVNYNIVFLYTLIALSVLLPVILFIRSLRSRFSWNNPAEHRKIRAALRANRRWCCTVIAGFALSVFSLTFIKAYLERGVELSPAEPMTIAGDEIVIPIEKIEDRHLHRYNYTAAENIEMRFIVIRKNEVAYGVGLDACDICGPTGYYERRDGVVCRLCDVVMNTSTIGFKGGCNPVPLAYTMRDGNMIIQTADLEAERLRFR